MKIAVRTVAVVLLGLALSLAAAGRSSSPGEEEPRKTSSGVVTTLDPGAKMFVMTDESQKKSTIHWNDATHFSGADLFQGALVKVQAVERDGKVLATSVHVQPAKTY